MASRSQGSAEVIAPGGATDVARRPALATRRSSLELGVVPTAVRTARHWTASLLAEAQPPSDPDFIDTVALLVSELVTNAIDAAAALSAASKPRVWLAIASSAERVRIEVHDSACIPLPRACQRGPDDETGRGLTVISALASDWGWHPDSLGKVVWCEVAVNGL